MEGKGFTGSVVLKGGLVTWMRERGGFKICAQVSGRFARCARVGRFSAVLSMVESCMTQFSHRWRLSSDTALHQSRLTQPSLKAETGMSRCLPPSSVLLVREVALRKALKVQGSRKIMEDCCQSSSFKTLGYVLRLSAAFSRHFLGAKLLATGSRLAQNPAAPADSNSRCESMKSFCVEDRGCLRHGLRFAGLRLQRRKTVRVRQQRRCSECVHLQSR